MANEILVNDFTTTLNGSISSGATSLVVNDSPTSAMTAGQFRVRIDDELFLVTAVGGSGNKTWTVSPGQESTTQASHSSGVSVYVVVTAGGIDQWKRDQPAGAITQKDFAQSVTVDADHVLIVAERMTIDSGTLTTLSSGAVLVIL